MNREEFFSKLDGFDTTGLKKVLWNLYWRGAAPVRQRIEAELDPVAHAAAKAQASAVDPEFVLDDVREFVALARSGAYFAGDRRVSPRERTQWRVTFRRMVADTRAALVDPEGVSAGAAAMELLIDLACAMKERDYFRSEDPVEAARFVVSDAAALLWEAILRQHGFAAFAEAAAPQLVRWESRHGWTRTGYGKTAEKETTLADVLARMLRVADAWATFADRYLDALDDAAAKDGARETRDWMPDDWGRVRRAEALAEWNRLLLERLGDDESDHRLERLAGHLALAGPDQLFFKAQLARQRGDLQRARALVHDCLEKYQGSQRFLDFAAEIDAPLPPRAQQSQARSGGSATIGSAPLP